MTNKLPVDAYQPKALQRVIRDGMLILGEDKENPYVYKLVSINYWLRRGMQQYCPSCKAAISAEQIEDYGMYDCGSVWIQMHNQRRGRSERSVLCYHNQIEALKAENHRLRSRSTRRAKEGAVSSEVPTQDGDC